MEQVIVNRQILTAPQNISLSGNVRKTGLQNTSEKQTFQEVEEIILYNWHVN